MTTGPEQLTLGLLPEPPPVNLRDYDIILINTSAGKDSQAMLDYIVEQARVEGVMDRLVAVHADLGRVEWQGTRELAEAQAKHYNIRFEVVKKNGGDLLEHIEKRGMWPSNQQRYCTSDYKRAPVRTLMTRLVQESGWQKGDSRIRILNCMGLRAEESPPRAKREPFRHDDSASNKTKRDVDEWLPIQSWSEREVWKRIYESGVPHHPAYDLGMKRLSCVFCVFAPRKALLIAGQHNPELLNDYVAAERRMGHTFRVDQSLVEIQNTLKGEKAR
jgi:3'-phosphoadenosine 5'-phosphosulfate sulfotransferase (PAPS reductase)/FAD synthetase